MNKNYIIIGVLSVILVVLCGIIAYNLMADNTEYTSTVIAESGTILDIPDNMAVKSDNEDSGIVVLENDNTVVVLFNSADKSISQIMAFASIKNPIFGTEFGGNVTLANPNVAGCNLEGECNGVFISNNETHDNIIVFSKDKNIVNHIINSIEWGNMTVSNDDGGSAAVSESSSSQPSAYAYKSDGTPMYNEKEVQDYMLNKYGMVEYHVGDNGYIDMDEPGFDDAGNKIRN